MADKCSVPKKNFIVFTFLSWLFRFRLTSSFLICTQIFEIYCIQFLSLHSTKWLIFWEDHWGKGITWICKTVETVSCVLSSPLKNLCWRPPIYPIINFLFCLRYHTGWVSPYSLQVATPELYKNVILSKQWTKND